MKLKITPTCFGSYAIHHQGVKSKHKWTTANFSQVQLCTPWWWLTYDPKHVGVIFNFMPFKIFKNFYTT